MSGATEVIDGFVAIGDYTNGRFSGRTYRLNRVEHDPGVASLVMYQDFDTPRYAGHLHVNIPTKVLRKILKAQVAAEKDHSYYPHTTTLPEVKD